MKTFSRSFAGGEISQEMYGRIDDAKFQTGAGLLSNFIATPQGPAQNRAGFAYVNSTKGNGVARLIPFTFNQSQTMVLELGNLYIRFHTMGATLLSGGVPYEIVTPYVAADLFAIHFVQSADVLTLVHPSYPPAEVRRLGATNWTYSIINFGAPLTTPTGVAVTASPGFVAQIVAVNVNSNSGDPNRYIETASPHNLSLGDGVYANGLFRNGTDISGFYQVSLLAFDSNGKQLVKQLQLTDYSGYTLDQTGTFTFSPGTIQLGNRVYDIHSYYAVTAIGTNGTDQSLLSSSVSAINNLNVPGSFNQISWTAVTGAARYYVYKQKNGLWGYIGEAIGTSFTDSNIAPDFSITPKSLDTPFVGAGNYPAAVGYVEQRRAFAGTTNKPQTITMTNSGTESTFSYSLPSQDTDRIDLKIAAREVSGIRHIVPLGQLVLLTDSCEYAEFTTNDAPITPSTVGFRPQSFIGTSNVQPSVVNNNIIACAARGGHVREILYNLQAGGYVTGDLSLRTAHLFDLMTIADQTFSKAPLPIVWFVSSNGALLGLTYVPEQQVAAWHQHHTDGSFESVTCVAEGDEDRLYAVVRRTVNGNTVRYVERMASRLVGALADCFFVDAGGTYSGSPTMTISNLTWLEGKTVAVLADGAVQNQKTVTGGAITLDSVASKVQVGLPYVSDLQTLPLALMIDGYGQGTQKNLNRAYLRVYKSSGVKAGPSADALTPFKQRTSEPYGVPPNLQNGIEEIVITPSWNDDGYLYVRQENPLPLTVVACTLEVVTGG